MTRLAIALFLLLTLLASPVSASADRLAEKLTETYSPLIIAAINGDFAKLEAELPAGLTVVFADSVKIEGHDAIARHLTKLRAMAQGHATYTFKELNVTDVIKAPAGGMMIRGVVVLERHPVGGGDVAFPVPFQALIENGVIYGVHVYRTYSRPAMQARGFVASLLSQTQAGALLAGALIGGVFVIVLTTIRQSRPEIS